MKFLLFIRFVYFQEGDETKLHYILKMPTSLPKVDLSEDVSNTFNIAMVDVSGSMGPYWDNVLDKLTEQISLEKRAISRQSLLYSTYPIFSSNTYKVKITNKYNNRISFISNKTYISFGKYIGHLK